MKKLSALLVIGFIACATTLQAQDSTLVTNNLQNEIAPTNRSYFGVALGVSASTNGLGVNINTALSKRFALRLGYEKVDMTFNNAFTFKQSDKSFEASPTWKTGGMSAIIDFYVFKGLYLSGGVIQTDMNLSATLTTTEAITVGSIEFKPDELGHLSLAVKPEEKIAPYAALGFGRNISRDHRLAMSLEMGAYYTKSYVVDLSGTKFFEANNNNTSIAELNKTLKEISWSGIYPVIKLAISYKFIGKNR